MHTDELEEKWKQENRAVMETADRCENYYEIAMLHHWLKFYNLQIINLTHLPEL